VEEIPARMAARWGRGTFVIPAPQAGNQTNFHRFTLVNAAAVKN
jgi:hypothetical protein